MYVYLHKPHFISISLFLTSFSSVLCNPPSISTYTNMYNMYIHLVIYVCISLRTSIYPSPTQPTKKSLFFSTEVRPIFVKVWFSRSKLDRVLISDVVFLLSINSAERKGSQSGRTRKRRKSVLCLQLNSLHWSLK